MTALLKRYYEIMNDYRKGKFGQWLSVGEIFEMAGESNLLEQMSSAEIRYICDQYSYGGDRRMFMPYLRAAKEREQLAEQAARQALNNDLAATTAAAV